MSFKVQTVATAHPHSAADVSTLENCTWH